KMGSAGFVGLEKAGAFEHQVDSHCPVRQLARIALLGHRDVAAVDLDAVAVGGHGARESPVRRIVGEQQRIGLRVGQVVDRDELEIVVAALEDGPRDEPTDAPETVDRNFRRHEKSSYYLPSLSIICGT